jgi:hypothetical protein
MQINHCITLNHIIEVRTLKTDFVGIVTNHNLAKKIKNGEMRDRFYLSWRMRDGTRSTAGYQI